MPVMALRLPLFATLGLALSAFSLAAEPATPIALLTPGLAGWTLSAAEPADLAATATLDAAGVLHLTGKPNGYLATTESHKNYQLHAEWRWTEKPGNAGFLLHISDGPKDRVWPTSIQVQTKHTRAGDVLPMAAAKFTEPLTSEPGKTAVRDRQADASEKPVGEWNVADIVCHDGSIEITINGVRQNTITGSVPAAGRIGLQLEGAPYEVRALNLTPLR